MDVLASTDSFTVEVLAGGGLVIYYVLSFVYLESRRVSSAGITDHADECWMRQRGRTATLEQLGYLNNCRYVWHDRNAKFCVEFRETLTAGDVTCLPLPPRSPNLNAFAEGWMRSVNEECLSKLLLFGEASLRRALTPFQERYHSERNHQGKGNVLLFTVLTSCRRAVDHSSSVESGSAVPQVLPPAGRMSFLTIWVLEGQALNPK
jgi:hypothetical protein